MKSQYRIAVLCVALVVVAMALLRFAPGVGATASGEIAGTVKFDGQAPHPKPIDMSKDPSCAKTHTGAPAVTENVITGANGGLANVVVYISQGPAGYDTAVSPQPVKLDQKGCQYIPHVVAVNVGQHLSVLNDDHTAHNMHPEPKPGSGNVPWNKSQMEGSPAIDAVWTNPEVAIPVRCNIHPWMHAYIAVVKGPFSVTDGQGSFKLSNLAPGTYTLTVWHETYGAQTQTVTLAAGKPASADFTYKAK